MRRLGVHTSIAGGLYKSIERAHELGCSTLQIFSHNPRGWALKGISEKDRDLFKKLKNELGINPVYIHTSYLINLASPSESLRGKSILLLKEEMNRADTLGAEYVVLHTGSASDTDKKTARKRAIKALKEVFRSGSWNAELLLENTAGERGDITSEIKELAEIMDALSGHVSGVCIDTCHAFAAGYDIRKEKGIGLISGEIKKYLGRDKVKLIHLNDSKAGLGKHRDRHEHIGMGHIGLNGFKFFLKHSFFSGIPLILETPKKKESDDKKNLKRVRQMLAHSLIYGRI
jgi:deoxyribonuclease-4